MKGTFHSNDRLKTELVRVGDVGADDVWYSFFENLTLQPI